MNFGAKVYRTDENGEVNINVNRKGNTTLYKISKYVNNKNERL